MIPKTTKVLLMLSLSGILALPGCSKPAAREPGDTPGDDTSSFRLQSGDFESGEAIPTRCAYPPEGQNRAPHLRIIQPPKGTAEMALIVDDPDAPSPENPRPEGPWVHWLLYGIPPQVTEIHPAMPGKEQLEDLQWARQGTNDFGEIGYGGPLPPPGPEHRYIFRLYALDRSLDLPSGASKQELLDAMDGHIIETTELIGTYQR